MIIYDFIGWCGTIYVVVAYFLLVTRRLKSMDMWYYWLNGFGATFLIVSSIHKDFWPGAALNIIWLFIALYGALAKRFTALALKANITRKGFRGSNPLRSAKE